MFDRHFVQVSLFFPERDSGLCGICSCCVQPRCCLSRLSLEPSSKQVPNSMWLTVPLPCHSSAVCLTTRSVFNASSAQGPLEDLVCDSGDVVHASRFSVSGAVLAAIVVGVCGSALANFLLQGSPLRFQLFQCSLGKGGRIFNEVWVWVTLSQVVRAAWAAAGFALGYLEFVVDASAAAASAGAWITWSHEAGPSRLRSISW